VSVIILSDYTLPYTSVTSDIFITGLSNG